MKKETKSFLKNLSNRKETFIFKKFYYKPEAFFTKTKEDLDKEDYYDIENVDYFIDNNNFIDFLIYIFDEEEFYNRVSYYVLRSLNVFLSKYYDEKDEFNENVINRVRFEIRLKYTREIKPIEIKKEVIRRLNESEINEDYYLYNLHSLSDLTYTTVVCNNDFLSLVEKRYLNENIDNHLIEIIMEILCASVRIKTHNYYSCNEQFISNRINKNDIDEFDINKAENLLKLVEEKINKKIVYFNAYLDN